MPPAVAQRPRESSLTAGGATRLSSYDKRDGILKEMGYSSYSTYLKSPLWADIRLRALLGNRHCGCGSPATQVHHREYTSANLTGESLRGLLPVCRYCHRQAEIAGGKKTSLKEANARLDKIFKRNIKRRNKKSKWSRGWCANCEHNRSKPDHTLCPYCAKKQEELAREMREAAHPQLGEDERPSTTDSGHDTKTSPAGASPGILRSSEGQCDRVRAHQERESGESQSTVAVVDPPSTRVIPVLQPPTSRVHKSLKNGRVPHKSRQRLTREDRKLLRVGIDQDKHRQETKALLDEFWEQKQSSS